jgi:hypothetical protein
MDVEAIRDGMTVYSSDGERLGKVIRRSGDTLLIEKGLFFKKDYLARFADVERVEDDRIWLRRTRQEIEGPELEEAEPAEPPRAPDRSADQASGRTDGARMSAAGFSPDGVIVVVEEEVEIVEAPGRRSDKDPDTRE